MINAEETYYPLQVSAKCNLYADSLQSNILQKNNGTIKAT